MALTSSIKPGDWVGVRKEIQRLSKKLGFDSTPLFTDLTITSLTASQLVQSDTNKKLISVSDLTAWIAQDSANRVVVTDDGDGTITLSLPQDIHVDATPEFAGLTIKNSSDVVIFYVDDDEMYFTASAVIEIADGMSIGLLLALTYKI